MERSSSSSSSSNSNSSSSSGSGTSWSTDALQAMETHLRLLHTSSSSSSSSSAATRERALAVGSISSSPVALQVQVVDLNSQEPLPHGWEQFLHLQTGQVYYVDWKSCRRSYMDPRKLQTSLTRHSNNGSLMMTMNKYSGFMGHSLPPHDSNCMTNNGVDEALEVMTSDERDDDSTNFIHDPTAANAYLTCPASYELLFHDPESEVESSNFVTTPMLLEDWTLMELRGWGSHSSSPSSRHSDDDDDDDYGDDDDDARSEISWEMNFQNNAACLPMEFCNTSSSNRNDS